MRVNPWLLSALLLFTIIETTGILLRDTFAGTVALFIAITTATFLGIFSLSYLGSSISNAINERWIDDVKSMDAPFFNPMYFTWLFAKRRLEWAYWTTFISAALALLTSLLFVTLSEITSRTYLIYGFLTGIAFLAFLTTCWIKGFCKKIWADWEETEQTVPERVEQEWRDKNL